MNHSIAWNGDVQRRYYLTVLVDQRVMDEWIFDIVTEGEQVSCFSVHLGVRWHVVSKLTIEVIMSDTVDVKILLVPIDLDFKWEVGLEKSVSFFTVLNKGGVCDTILVFVKRLGESDFFLKAVYQGLDHTWTRHDFTSSDFQCLSCFKFLKEFWRLSISIAIEKLSVFDSHSVDHWVTVEPLMSTVWWYKFGVWTISEVDSVDIFRNPTLDNVDDLIWLLFRDWSEITF